MSLRTQGKPWDGQGLRQTKAAKEGFAAGFDGRPSTPHAYMDSEQCREAYEWAYDIGRDERNTRVNKGPAADAMAEAVEALLSEETHDLHVGYDSGPGGGNFVYADVIRTDSDAFVALRQALAAYRESVS